MRSAGFRTRLLASLVTVASMLNLSSASIAQTYPSRGVKLVVPLAPGGPADTTARMFASALAEGLGQSVVVDNRTGASGVVGSSAKGNW